MWIELLGIIAGIIVLGSFISKEQKRIRIVNAIGSVVFIVYGVLITSYATIFLNGVMVLVQIVYLLRMKGDKK